MMARIIRSSRQSTLIPAPPLFDIFLLTKTHTGSNIEKLESQSSFVPVSGGQCDA